MASGIYAIENIWSGHRYIGSASNMARRWNAHRRMLRQATHDNIHLQRAWNRDGEDAFRFEVIEECGLDILIRAEQRHLDALCPEYNIALVAGSSLGVKLAPFSDDHRAKIGAAKTGKKRACFSAEWRAKLGAASKGRKHTSEECARISASNKGRTISAEQRARISATMTGRKLSPEHKAKIAAFRRTPAGHEASVRCGRAGAPIVNCKRWHPDRPKLNKLCAECAAKRNP